MKAFQPEERKVLTVTINEDGTLEYLKTDLCDVLLELGEVVTRRASHVEPASFLPRVWFHVVRRFVTDKSAIAAWTRNWKCEWRVNTAPVGGPILTWNDVYSPKQKREMIRVIETVGELVAHNKSIARTATWRNRQDAIDAEIKFLNEWFLSR